MGIKRRNISQNSGTLTWSRPFRVFIPAVSVGHFLLNQDPSTKSVGDVIQVNTWTAVPQSVSVGITDASGSALQLRLLLRGINQFNEDVVDTIETTVGTG